jgi:ATP-dependent RNA circularization protein (DNA/RNA ligase family)
MVDENNRFLNKYQMNDLTRGNPKVSRNMMFRHALKKDFSNYRFFQILDHALAFSC